MSWLTERGKEFLVKVGAYPKTCAVNGCSGGNVAVTELQPLDPIDHSSTLLQLCPTHTAWAEERNELASEVKAELVEKRQEIGKRRFAEIQELSMPQDGDLREDILMGDTDERYISLSDAFEDGESA